MKLAEMTIAKIQGGVFIDHLPGLKVDGQRCDLAEKVLQQLKKPRKDSTITNPLEIDVAENEIEIRLSEDPSSRKFQIRETIVVFEAARVKDFDRKIALELADVLQRILEVINRRFWNRVGIMFAVVLPSKPEAEKGKPAVTCLKKRILTSDLGAINRLFGNDLEVIDVTLKTKHQGRIITFNLYNTDTQDIVLTLDVKSSQSDAAKGDLLSFFRQANKVFVHHCGAYAESITEDDLYKGALDFDYLRWGER